MSTKPEKVFQHGGVRAAVFANQYEKSGKPFTVKRVSFQKLYRDNEGRMQSTSTLELNDLPKAVLVLQKAYDYLTARPDLEDMAGSS